MLKIFTRSLVAACLLFTSLISNAQNEVELRLIPIDCDYGMTAFLAGVPGNYATYDWGDGSTSTANWAYVDHTYSSPGDYTVTVINDFITYVETVSIEDCGCPTSLEPIQIYGQCSSVSMRVDTYIYSLSDYNVDWTWGDGSASNNGWGYPTGYHTYAEEGTYEICGTFTGPGCEDGVELCTSVDIEFCDEPCYYEPPYFEYDQTTCSYSLGVIEAPQDIIWTSNGEELGIGNWLSGVSLPEGTNEICMDILPNLDWNCPLGYTECFTIEVPESSCGTPEFSYEETSCGILEFQFEINGAPIEVTSVHFGNGVSQDLTNGENFEHYYSVLPGVYEVCIFYYEIGTTVTSELCYQVEVEGCPEQFCWAEIWGEETECNFVQVNLWTELDVFQNEEVYWDFGDGSFEYGFGWAGHEYEEPGTYVICAELWSEFCPNGIYSCFTIEVEGCEEECTQPIVYEEVECGEWYFSVGENFSVEFANWDFGDGTTAQSPMDLTVNTTHQYTSSGTYEVCVEYFDLECQTQSMHEVCFTVEVEVCNEACLAELIYWEEECGTFYFEVIGVDGIGGIEWDFGNGEFDYSQESFITHTFENNGTFLVCPWFYSELCQEVIGDCCVDIDVTCLEEVCNDISYNFTDCLEAQFYYEGEADGLFDQWVVMQDGAVYLDYETQDGTSITFPSSGYYQVGVSDALDCEGNIQPYFIEVYVEECVECTEITVENIECEYGMFSYYGEIDYSTYSTLCWEVYDDNGNLLSTYLDGEQTDYSFLVSGTYTVLVTNAVPCDGVIPSVEVQIEACEEDCISIMNYVVNCNYVSIFIPNGTTEFYLDFGNGTNSSQFSWVNYEGPGTYQVCGEFYMADCQEWVYECIEVVVEDCSDCNDFIEVEVDCQSIEVSLIENLEIVWVDFGDQTAGSFDSDNIFHEYAEAGWYTVCAEYYNPACNLDIYICNEVFVEGCEEDCESELMAEDLGCGLYEISVTEGSSNIYLGYYQNGENFADLLVPTGEHIIQIQFEESGTYSVWTEYIHPDCGYYVGGEILIEVEICEDDCVPVTITFDGDFGALENYTELLSGVITGDDGVIWEGLIPLSTFVTSVTVEMCIPPGCYSFEIMNEDPLALVSLDLALQSISSDQINVQSSVDLMSGSLETTLGVMQDCSTGIEELSPEVSIYPNPSSDLVNIQFENSGWNYQVLDIIGRLVQAGISTDISERLDVTKWADGMYILKAIKNEKTLHAKFQVKK